MTLAAARTARLSVTRRLAGRLADGDGGGMIVAGGKAVDVPSYSPLYAKVEEMAQQLQDTGVTAGAKDQASLSSNGYGDLASLAASLADQLSQMETPREPQDGVPVADIPASPSDGVTEPSAKEGPHASQNGTRSASVPASVLGGTDTGRD